MKKRIYNFTDITIILSKDNKEIKTQFKKYDLISSVKKKIEELFFPFPKDMTLKCDNINLSNFLDNKIGDLFPKKTFITINIVKEFKTPFKKNNSNKRLLLINRSNLFNNNISLTATKSKQNLELKLPKISQKLFNYSSINNSNYKNYMNTNITRANDSITKKKNFKTNFLEQYYMEDYNLVHLLICDECRGIESNSYCRHCDKFICNFCIPREHNNLKDYLIPINKSYKMTFFAYNDKLNHIFNENLKVLSRQEENNNPKINIDKFDKILKDNIDTFIEKYKLKEEKQEKIKDENMKFFKDDDYQNELKQIEEIKCQINLDPFKSFTELYNKDKTIYKLLKIFKKYPFQEKNLIVSLDEKLDELESDIDNITNEFEIVYYSK